MKTPRKAIRSFCLFCAGSAVEVKRCEEEDCLLFPYRLPSLKGRVSTKTIKAQCQWCQGVLPKELLFPVAECADKECPLYPYRLGNNPNRKGVGLSYDRLTQNRQKKAIP